MGRIAWGSLILGMLLLYLIQRFVLKKARA